MFGVRWQTSERQYRIKEERDQRIRMSDGIEIDADVFRPDAEGKFPALIAASPYSKQLQSEGRMPEPISPRTPPEMMGAGGNRFEFFVPRGYGYIIASSRGTGKSGGAWQFLNPRESRDYYELVEWAAAQPWCNGKVGTIGFSYFSMYAANAAALQPPHLKAVFLTECGADHYRDGVYHGGILLPMFLLTWGASCKIHTQASYIKKELGEEGYKQAIETALQDKDISAHPGLVAALKDPEKIPNALVLDYLLHPTDGPYHQEKNPQVDKIKVPVFIEGSWGSMAMHLPGTYQLWNGLKKGLPKKMIIGPSPAVERPMHSYQNEILRWYDYWLKGIDTGIMDEPPIRLLVQGENKWRTTTDWPLPETKWMPFNLHPNGLLSEMEPRKDGGSDVFEDSPEKRESLKYCTGAVLDDVEVIGNMVLKLYASSTHSEALFFISLWDQNAKGEEELITRGWLRGTHRELDMKKSKPWLPFHPHTNPKPLVPGEIYEFTIQIMPTGYQFKAGHRIVLKINGVDNEVPPPGRFYIVGHLWNQIAKKVTIYHDTDHTSCLFLPITKGNISETYICQKPF